MFKRDELKLLWPLYLSKLLLGISLLITPFYVIYFRELGFSFLQIEFMAAVVFASMIFFEIPTGAIADIYGRKKSTFLGYFIVGAVSILIALTKSYYLILVLWVIYGLGYTFISGAEEALVVDLLNKKKRKDLIPEYFTKEMSIVGLGFVLAPTLAGIIVKFLSKNLLWFFQGIGIIIGSLMILFFVKEEFNKKEISISKVFRNGVKQAKDSIKYSTRHSVLFAILIAGMFVTIGRICTDGWQPLLVSLTMPEHYLGYDFI